MLMLSSAFNYHKLHLPYTEILWDYSGLQTYSFPFPPFQDLEIKLYFQ